MGPAVHPLDGARRRRYLAHPMPGPTEDAAALSSPLLVLASGSPRRREILTEAGIAFEICPADIDESSAPDETPDALVARLACEKAEAVARRLSGDAHRPRPVLGSDTIVVAGDGAAAEVLGKPRDEAHAVELLGKLVGRTHRVMTAIAVTWTDGRPTRSNTVVSRVTMRAADRGELEDYVAVGESLDKAGGYALQGEGRRFVTGVEGSRTNVIGLPIEETIALLEEAGHSLDEPTS